MSMNEGYEFSALFNLLPQGAFRISLRKSDHFEYVNESLATMLGYTVEELLGLDPYKIFTSKRAYQNLMSKVQKGTAVIKDQEITLKTKADENLICRTTLAGGKNSRGEVRHMEGVIENVSNQYQLVRDLADSKELFKTVFNNSPVGIIVSDKEMHIIAWNPFAEQMLGMNREDLFNVHLKKLFSLKDWMRLKIGRIFRKGFLPDIEAEIIRKNGSRMDAGISLSAIRDIQGEIIGAIAIMHDVSEQKRSHKMLLEAKKSAEEASKSKTMFLANMSHEVRTPMNTIMGMIDLTLDTELTGEQLDNLKIVKNAADILLSLLNDILDLSRVEAGKIQLEYIEISIEKIVESVFKTMYILAKNKKIDFKWSVDKKIPQLVKGDPVRIRQILVNLVNNAIKFTSQGGIEVHVKSLSEKGGQCELEFSVKDDGVGIPEDKLDAVFEVFTQADVSTTRKFGGTGLGLSICKRLVELMHGEIWVKSKVGLGSTFYFSSSFEVVKKEDIPAALQEESLVDQLMAQLPGKKFEMISGSGQALHILLAEDNLVNQKIAARMLEKKGWTVEAVGDGQEVLKMLEKQKFDVILMDVQMPVIGGIEATRLIRENEQKTGGHIPIVALTARVMSGDREEFLESGMDGYISKPIDRAQMYETIEALFK